MFGLKMLDVVIGLVFVYSLLSLICLTLNEFVAQWFDLRAEMLYKGLAAIVSEGSLAPWKAKTGAGVKDAASGATDPARRQLGDEVVRQFYAHPLIASLEERRLIRGRDNTAKPAYIPTDTFVTALVDCLRLNPAPVDPPPTEVPAPGAKPGPVAEPAPIAEPAAGVEAPVVASPFSDMEALKGVIANAYVPATLKRQLQLVVERSGGGVEKTLAGFGAWFDGVMERVKAEYKRRLQFIGFLVALVVTIAANADTIRIVRALGTDPKAREALVAAATQYVQKRDSVMAATASGTANATRARNPAPAAGSESAAAAAAASPSSPAATQARDSGLATDSQNGRPLPSIDSLKALADPLAAALRDAQEAGLPIGWESAGITGVGDWVKFVVASSIGYLLTALALTLGAPFWFDILKQLVNLRGSARNPDEAKKEKKKLAAA